MSHSDYYFRQQCILRKLQRGPASLDEIKDYYELECETHGYAFTFSNRNFIRDKNEIFSMFKKEISYNTSLRKYFLEEDNMPDDFGERIADTFNTYLALNMMEGIADFVHLEKRRPQGMEHFSELMQALKGKLLIRFEYEKYDNSIPSERKAEPLALKEFESRWYLLAKDQKDNAIKAFALDRMSCLEITKQKFKVITPFNVNQYFEHCFGITRPSGANAKPEKIVLSFKGNKGKYIKSLPLHASQQIIKEQENELQVQLELFITHDFVMELLKHGNEVVVLSPLELRETMNGILSSAGKQYAEEKGVGYN
jgi:predicted DNA-binding transcriptional regulator YafY